MIRDLCIPKHIGSQFFAQCALFVNLVADFLQDSESFCPDEIATLTVLKLYQNTVAFNGSGDLEGYSVKHSFPFDKFTFLPRRSHGEGIG